MNEINWLKKNRRYLNIKAIAEDAGVKVRALNGVVKGQKDGHGTPIKLPEGHEALTKIINQITKIK